MKVSLSSLAQRCAESGLDIFDEDLGPHWGRCVAELLMRERPPDVGVDTPRPGSQASPPAPATGGPDRAPETPPPP